MHIWLLVAIPLLVSGCGETGLSSTPDASVDASVDFARSPQPDIGACTEAKFVTNVFNMPQQSPASANYSYDLNGDGKRDNAFLGLVTALKSQGLGVQNFVDTAVAGGNDLILIGAFSNCGAATFDNARPHPSPDFSGSGSFMRDTSLPSATFSGGFAGGVFSSAPTASATTPVSFTIELALLGAQSVQLPLSAAHVTFAQSATQLSAGQLNGCVKKSDIQTTLVPALAKDLDATVRANPTSSTSQGILGLYDTGTGCTGTDYNYNATDTAFDTSSPAAAGDGLIALCEVANNGLTKSLLRPDVQMFASDGSYAPNPANTTPDCMSIGLGFSAVSATF
jgi:hypothetical protein